MINKKNYCLHLVTVFYLTRVQPSKNIFFSLKGYCFTSSILCTLFLNSVYSDALLLFFFPTIYWSVGSENFKRTGNYKIPQNFVVILDCKFETGKSGTQEYLIITGTLSVLWSVFPSSFDDAGIRTHDLGYDSPYESLAFTTWPGGSLSRR